MSKEHKHKARLCALGNTTSQSEESTFASGIVREYARAQIAIAAAKGEEIRLGDCKQAYLSINRKDVNAPRLFIRVRKKKKRKTKN